VSALDDVFARLAEENRAAFIPYLTGGDPDLATTSDLVATLVDAGADIIEIGVPFSDPIADGPVNQRSATRALEAGTTLSGILDLVARHRSRSEVPIVLFSYFNPLFVRGIRQFAAQAADSGVDGVLCVDLPPGEAAEEFSPSLREQGIDTIFLLSPTSTRERIDKVADLASGFVYYVSRTGVTGEQRELETELGREVKRVRRRLKLPLAVGFGISTPDQVATVARMAEGVVVGSALVRIVEENQREPDLAERLGAFARSLASATGRQSRRRRRG
jgi:tryptophan synthase alpha chain